MIAVHFMVQPPPSHFNLMVPFWQFFIPINQKKPNIFSGVIKQKSFKIYRLIAAQLFK